MDPTHDNYELPYYVMLGLWRSRLDYVLCGFRCGGNLNFGKETTELDIGYRIRKMLDHRMYRC